MLLLSIRLLSCTRKGSVWVSSPNVICQLYSRLAPVSAHPWLCRCPVTAGSRSLAGFPTARAVTQAAWRKHEIQEDWRFMTAHRKRCTGIMQQEHRDIQKPRSAKRGGNKKAVWERLILKGTHQATEKLMHRFSVWGLPASKISDH